ncbi:MAG TPA: SDR family oxidoreductase [Thermoplasmata archaeon]|nr:SDR family oxidoreductase [Thermoplasmata archaeon]
MRGPMGALDGRCALITGASGGMGRATAIEFAKEGAKGIGLQYSRNREAAESVSKAVRSHGAKPLLLQADVADREACHRVVKTFVQRFHRIDALVCYAGYPFRKEVWFAGFEGLTEDAFLGPFRVDLLGSAFAAQAAAPVMKKAKRGAIVLVGSTPAITGDRVGIPYFVAKAGVLALTKGLAQILGPFNVHVNAIAPGAVDTEAMAGLPPKEAKTLAQEAALKRRGAPLEIARKAVFLCSDDASFMTGVTLVVDGGYAMR